MKLFDLHVDTLRKLYDHKARNLDQNDLHVDLHKLRTADSYAQCLALFNRKPETGYVYSDMLDFCAFALDVLAQHSDAIALVRAVSELETNRQAGKLSVLLTIEDLGPLCGQLEGIRALHRLGIRMMGLTWNHENSLGYPKSDDASSMALGLKPFGIEAVELMNELGIVVDVSHLSDGGFYDVAKYSKKPFVASHSNARAVTQNPRNLTDEMIRILAERGGVMGINVCPEFLSDDHHSTVQNMLRHIRHIHNVGGIECLAVGTDFDGTRGELEISDISKMGLLASALVEAGFTHSEVEKIFYQNALRVFSQV